MYRKRLQSLQKNIPKGSAFFLTKESDIHYYCGFDFLVSEEREAYLVVTNQSANLLHASFSPVTKLPFINYFTHIYKSKLQDHLQEIIKKDKINQIEIDHYHTFVYELNLISSLKGIKVEQINPLLIPKQKMVKDEFELKNLRKTCQISKQSFLLLKKKLKVGMTELEVQKLLEEIMNRKGSQKTAFPTIIAFGANSALPHHQPTNKKLEKEMAVLIDFGATYKNYKADMTRSFWFGDKPNSQYQDIFDTVMASYQKALLTTKNNHHKPISNIDKAARDHINKAQYGQFFIHTTGHGLGLDIHEYPSVSYQGTTLLDDNMVFTIEPGIYLEGKFGVRYENTIHYTKEKTFELTL